MIDGEEFREQNPPERIEPKLPERPLSTLNDILYFYGLLHVLGLKNPPEEPQFYTPGDAREFADTPESLVAVNVDLSGSEPKLGSDPAFVSRYSEELIAELTHSRYWESSRGIDHSITHQPGKNSRPSKLARYAAGRLTKWPDKDPVRSVANTHPDGWILDALRQLGEKEEEIEQLKEAVQARLGGRRTALVTARIKVEPDGEYHWPGEFEVLQEAAKSRKRQKLVSKGAATESEGQAVGAFSDEETRVVGTPGDPLRSYQAKQREKFPGLDPDRAWQTQPLSEATALLTERSRPFLDACTYSSFGSTIHYLPYPHGKPTAQEAYDIYHILSGMRGEAGESHATPIERAYREIGETIDRADLDLRFYVAAVAKQQMSRWDVFGETLNGSIVHPVDLAQAHLDVLESTLFSQQAVLQQGSPPLRTAEDWALLDVENEKAALRLVTTGRYFYETFPDVGEDGDAAADDPRIQALVSVLGGEPLVVEDLIASYAERLVADEGDSFPSHTMNSQYAQLQALARADLLRAETARGEPLTEPFQSPNDPTMSQSANTSSAKQRDEKLEAFLERSPALADDSERRSSFLLGALVGHVSSYQQRSSVSLTVVDQHPVGGLTKTNVKRRTQEVLGKNIVYSREKGLGSTMYAEVVDRLRESILETDPSEWKLPLEDLRFYYALGVSYGMNDYPTQQEDSSVEVEAIQES